MLHFPNHSKSSLLYLVPLRNQLSWKWMITTAVFQLTSHKCLCSDINISLTISNASADTSWERSARITPASRCCLIVNLLATTQPSSFFASVICNWWLLSLQLNCLGFSPHMTVWAVVYWQTASCCYQPSPQVDLPVPFFNLLHL